MNYTQTVFSKKKLLLCLQFKIQETEGANVAQKIYKFCADCMHATHTLLTALAFLFSPKRKHKWQRQLVLKYF